MTSRVLLDTNVILSGAWAPDSTAAQLAAVRGRVQFLMTASILAETRTKLGQAARSAAYADAARAMVDSYLDHLGVLQVPDPPRSAAGHDAHVICAADALGAEWIATYNVRDMSAANARALPPAGILRVIDPKYYLVEHPLPWESEGSLICGFRQYPDSILGQVVADADGNVLGEWGDRRLRLEGPGVEAQQSFAELPYGHSVDLWVRFRTVDGVGSFEADAWMRRRPDEWPSATPTRLFEGSVRVATSIDVRLAFGANYGFSGGLSYTSGLPRLVRQRNVRLGIFIGTLEGSWGSEALEDLLRGIKIEGTDDVLGVRPARSRRRTRWPRFSR